MFLNLIIDNLCLKHHQHAINNYLATMSNSMGQSTTNLSKVHDALMKMLAGMNAQQLETYIKMLSLMKEQMEQTNPSPNQSTSSDGPDSVATLLSKQVNTKEPIVLPSRKTRWVKNITQEQNIQKYNEQKYIAQAFIQYGINYQYITRTYPNMPPKTYRCYVEAINNQTVNEIVEFLRYECNTEIQRLNRDQKRSIRTQLTKVRDWLGHKHPDQLQIFYKFILRHYDKKIEIKREDALELYRTILRIIKSPYVNVLAEGKEEEEKVVAGLKEDEAQAMIIAYIKWRDLTKVTDVMCQKYSYDVKFSFHSIKNSLRQLLDISVDKLLKNLKPNQTEIYSNLFTPKNRNLLHDIPDIDMKIDLYSYYLEKVTRYDKVKNLVHKLRGFFETYSSESSQVSLPKVEVSAVSGAKLEHSMKTEEVSEFNLTKTVDKPEAGQAQSSIKNEPDTASEETDSEVKIEPEDPN